jgi:polyisoprenoid-binding protein YceI
MSTTTRTASPSPPATNALAGTWHVDPDGSHARFTARTLAGMVKVPGSFRSLGGSLLAGADGATGFLAIDAAGIDTGNRMRDRHLRSSEFFAVSRHPELRYDLRAISLTESGTVAIDGELDVAGTRTPLTLDAELRAHGDDVVELASRIEVDRFSLGVRGGRGIVPAKVELDVTVRLRRETA